MAVLVLAACLSPEGTGERSTAPAPILPPETSAPPAAATSLPANTRSDTVATGDLDSPEVRHVMVDGRSLLVAWADTDATRSRGLMEVEDLGDLDGMLFDLGTERRSSFTMRNTLIPLDIYFFDAEGGSVGMLEMVPCEGEPCPTYDVGAPARYALEVPAGSLTLGDVPELVIR